jgi:hypothetical protein
MYVHFFFYARAIFVTLPPSISPIAVNNNNNNNNLNSNEQHVNMGSPADVSDVHAASIFRAGFHNTVACRAVVKQ